MRKGNSLWSSQPSYMDAEQLAAESRCNRQQYCTGTVWNTTLQLALQYRKLYSITNGADTRQKHQQKPSFLIFPYWSLTELSSWIGGNRCTTQMSHTRMVQLYLVPASDLSTVQYIMDFVLYSMPLTSVQIGFSLSAVCDVIQYFVSGISCSWPSTMRGSALQMGYRYHACLPSLA